MNLARAIEADVQLSETSRDASLHLATRPFQLAPELLMCRNAQRHHGSSPFTSQMPLDAEGRIDGCDFHGQPLLSHGPQYDGVVHDTSSETEHSSFQ